MTECGCEKERNEVMKKAWALSPTQWGLLGECKSRECRDQIYIWGKL